MKDKKKVVPERICLQIDAIYQKVKKEVEERQKDMHNSWTNRR